MIFKAKSSFVVSVKTKPENAWEDPEDLVATVIEGQLFLVAGHWDLPVPNGPWNWERYYETYEKETV